MSWPTELMHLPNDEIQTNIDAFIEEHGVEGFFQIYLREYLFEMLMAEIKAATDELESDSAVQLYFGQSEYDDLEEFEDQLQDECADRAGEMVQEIKNSDELRPFFEDADVELLETREAEEIVKGHMHDIIEEWKE